MRVLISGASIAGPTLAYWLDRYGFDVTVVELAPALRQGGYAVDFRGGIQLAQLERMGLLDQVRAHQTGGQPARFVDETGATVLSMPREFTGGNLEIQRADLSRLLYDDSRERVEYRFGRQAGGQPRAARVFEAGTTKPPPTNGLDMGRALRAEAGVCLVRR